MGYNLTLCCIVFILNEFYGGCSLRRISVNFREIFSLPISPPTILRRIADAVRIVDEAVTFFLKARNSKHTYGKKRRFCLRLQLGKIWEIDEIFIRLEDEKYPLIVVRDLKTGFIIVALLSETASYEAIKQALSLTKAFVRKYPAEIRGDGNPAYPRAVRVVFRGKTKFTLHKKVGRKGMNQSIEGTFSGLRSRLKTMRGLHSRELSPIIIKGLILDYNFVRVSDVLGGKTPAEMALHWKPIDCKVGGWRFLLGLAKYYKRTVLGCKKQKHGSNNGNQSSLDPFLIDV